MVNARKDFLWVAAEAETAAAFQTTVWSRSTPHHGGLVVVYSKGTRLLILKKEGRLEPFIFPPSFLLLLCQSHHYYYHHIQFTSEHEENLLISITPLPLSSMCETLTYILSKA